MDILGHELMGGITLELNDDLFDLDVTLSEDEMNVIGKDCAGLDGASGALDVLSEAAADGTGLDASELYRRILEGVFGGRAKRAIAVEVGYGSRLVGGVCRPVTKEIPRAYEIRPRAARIVGQPKAVRAEDCVMADDHVFLRPFTKDRLAATRSGARSRSAARRG
jgi:hypothetical protein